MILTLLFGPWELKIEGDDYWIESAQWRKLNLEPVSWTWKLLPPVGQPEGISKHLMEWWHMYLSGRLEPLSHVHQNLFQHLPFMTLGQFAGQVYRELFHVSPGQTLTYGELARRIGKPGAARAIGLAMKRNPWPVIVPCHRVWGKHGIGGYSPSVELKQKLMEWEMKTYGVLG